MPMACSYGQKPDLSMIKALIAVLLIACLSIISPLYIQPMFENILKDSTLGELEAAFKGIPHPKSTQQIVLQKEAGQFTGDDKNCDFFVGEVRSYKGTPESIRAFYERQKVKDFGDARVIMLENGLIPEAEKANLPGNLNSLSQWNLPSTETQLLYIVYVFSADYNTGSKLQCH